MFGADIDALVMTALKDGDGDYLAATGAVLATGLALMVDKEVERLDVLSGMLDKAVTITVQRHLLQPLDRKGAFCFAGKTWHIDGIAADDGHLITFFVVP